MQNTENKEKKLKTLQMPAKEQIGMEIRSTARPFVLAFAKKNVLSSPNESVPQAVKQSITD